MVQVVPGFSKTNRWLLYTSFMLSPAQFMAGIGSRFPGSLGFLAYNWYTQYVWYTAAKAKQLDALSLIPVHCTLIYLFTYLGGATSGHIVLALPLGLGTAGLLVLNSITAWTCWATNLPDGYGIYQFFFFGWRTLTPGWRTFFQLWQIGDTFLAFASIIVAIGLSVRPRGGEGNGPSLGKIYLAMLCGPVAVLVFTWELIMWVELIVPRNDIESDTDMVAVWLFIAQVVLLLIPDPSSIMRNPWIASTLKRIPLAMSNWWTQSKTSDVLAERRPSEDSAVIKLEEGTQQDSKELQKHDLPEASAVIQVEGAEQNKDVLAEHGPSDPSQVIQLDGSQQNSDVLPEYSSPEASGVVQLEEGAQQTPNVPPKNGPAEASAVIQLEGPQQNPNVLPGSSEVPTVQLEQGAQQNPPGSS